MNQIHMKSGTNFSKRQIIVFDQTKIDKEEILKRTINDLKKDDRSITLCDIGDIVTRYRYMKNAMPRVHPYYAVKCNNDPIVLKTFAVLGSGFDCASSKEIEDVKKLETTSDRIIFANPTKPTQCIKHLALLNIQLMTFDCEEELIKIEKLFKRAKLVIRIKSNAKKAAYDFGKKFGCDPISEAPNLLKMARDLDLDVVGVSFHVGSICEERDAYIRGIASCQKVFQVGFKLGFKMHLLDIGGGFHGSYFESIQDVTTVINDSLEKYFPDKNAVTVISEPGRYFVESACWIACNIHTKKISDNYHNDYSATKNEEHTQTLMKIDYFNEDDLNNDQNMRMYYMNDGICGIFNVITYEKLRAPPEPLEKNGTTKLYNSIIWGPTCYSDDKIPYIFKLPDLAVGEWLLFKQMGAYSLPLITDFNSMPRTKIIYMVEKELATLLMNNDLFSDCNFIDFDSFK